MRTLRILALLAAAAAPLAAQAVVDPGMSRDQVIAKLGKPATERTSGAFTYLFYSNGSERKVGMNDLVLLEGNKVVDAVFRSSARRYSGTSSSPAPISAEDARKQGGSQPPGGLRTKDPATKAQPPKKPLHDADRPDTQP
jgi:hypothetical protein